MRTLAAMLTVLLPLALPTDAKSQVVLTGRLLQPRFPGSKDRIPLSAVYAFASLDGPGSQALSFRTWETHPAGWYRLAGTAGNYTVVFSTPAHFMRPVVLTNLYARPGDTLDRVSSPAADYAVFDESTWDSKPAQAYCQTFVARGTSLTHVGFRLVHDGVDGAGPGRQNLAVSVHRQGEGTPDAWPQVGPAGMVLDVDSGGAKNYIWSAGWNSGEVPLEPGKTYAIRLHAEGPDGVFQAFWRPVEGGRDRCYRCGRESAGWVDRQLWMSVGTDGDGLLVPYNKRVHKQFVELTKFARKWSQTYVARGRGLAGVILYAAVSGVQPPLARQRVAVSVRRDGPAGPRLGITKIAIGNGNYTGDASWGTFGVAFAPGEVSLEPGKTYAIEFETIESIETLHGFVNCKGQVSDDRPGFNPYRKHPRDAYADGKAYLNASEAVDYDLDMQVIEYESPTDGWRQATERENLLAAGDMEIPLPQPGQDTAAPWKPFRLDPATTVSTVPDANDPGNHVLRVAAGRDDARTVDGGCVQRIDGLSRLETYRLSGRARASWPLDDKHECRIGYDPTGQDTDPQADTVVWTLLPAVHGVFVPYASDPIRPRGTAVSLWLRARATVGPDDIFPFRADFDDLALRRVQTGIPDGR